MARRCGDGAATEAAMRADEFLDQGNLDGQRVWIRIMQAIEVTAGATEGWRGGALTGQMPHLGLMAACFNALDQTASVR